MTTSRSESALIGMALAVALAGCDAPMQKAPANGLAAILEEPESRALSASLGRFIDARRSDPALLDRELRAAGFRRSDERAGCARYAYRGESKQVLSVDRTLRIRIEQCGSNPRTRTISVTRGDS
jgi:hypothetical protein